MASAQQTFETTLRQFESGNLTDPNGEKVTDKKQAFAMAFMNARKISPNYLKKSALTGNGK